MEDKVDPDTAVLPRGIFLLGLDGLVMGLACYVCVSRKPTSCVVSLYHWFVRDHDWRDRYGISSRVRSDDGGFEVQLLCNNRLGLGQAGQQSLFLSQIIVSV